ncbi:PadR family transcriptional regulator [Rheinheimera baltica]|uniref:PadR family transcriptional regulator n=1 Tax=Rheinheimera baltica TaxID=67576 RepID=UPI00273D8911|nr:PadR family transcriptional regulator [Rheinheimera baltica]MDP5151557.1 PadR family transcriptional regulator [Rheinheimera baltica]
MTTAQLDKMRLELRRGVLVLAALALLKQPHYGYSLRKQLQDSGIDIDEGTLYPLIRRLAEQGLLDSEWKHAEGRERRYYQLSTMGQEMLQQLTTEWRLLNGALGNLLSSDEEKA